ncbi:MAG TPA: AIR carboxylase family protein, partial [Gemmatimonadaceae bacterium]
MTTKHTDSSDERPWVGVIMGSSSDLKYMQPGLDILNELDIPHEAKIVSAHRTPDWMFAYAEGAQSRGIEVIIAAAGGAAHLPGMVAA